MVVHGYAAEVDEVRSMCAGVMRRMRPDEKRGSMINGAGRLQRLNKAISVPGLAMDDWQILLQLKAALGGGNSLYTIEEVFKAMAAAQPVFEGLSLSKIGDLGVELKPQAAPAAGRPQPSPHPTV